MYISEIDNEIYNFVIVDFGNEEHEQTEQHTENGENKVGVVNLKLGPNCFMFLHVQLFLKKCTG